VIAFKDDDVDRWTFTSDVDLIVDGNGTASGTLSFAVPGTYGSDLREFLKSARKDDVERVLQGWVSEALPGAKLERYDTQGQPAPSHDQRSGANAIPASSGLEPVQVKTEIIVPHFMVAEGNHLIAEQFFNTPVATRMLGLPSLGAYLRVPNRSTPLYLSELEERMTVSVTLPGSSLGPLEVPRSFKRSESYGDFEQEFTWDASSHRGKLVTQQDVHARRLSKEDFARFRDGVQEIMQASRNRLIVPIKPGAPLQQAKTD
jgi:hypothetical protein